ncbi:MAG: DivIVA domain-containing protein, partial [Candidatus Marinimicrobia bacterium]|nr:DivIVA domain-containing protein [Candidatus Neomarinimicrobiota bacterium]
MDIKLENLIEKIKTEGVEEAKKSSKEILENAKHEASSILKKAHKDADNIIEEAQKSAGKIKTNAESALRQAERDTVLVTKEKITKLFDRVFKKEVTKTLSPEFLR